MGTRKICEPFYSNFERKKVQATKLTLFEKICLFFIKEVHTKDDSEFTTYVIVTKTFRGKVYLIREYSLPPQHFNCRHKIIPFDYSKIKNPNEESKTI